MAAKSYYKTLLHRTEALEQTLNEVREHGTSLENLKKSGNQIALLIHQIEQLNEDLVLFYARTRVASPEVKVTEEAQISSTPTETPVSPRSDALVSSRNKVYDTPSTDHQSDAVNLSRESERERLQVLEASFNDNFYSLWSTKLLEHIDYFLAPHLETMEQNIIEGAIAQAERMRNRNEFPKAIKSLEDLDPNCAHLILDSKQGISSLTLEPKDVEMILRGVSKRNWYPFKPLFNESNGDISYERFPNRDDEFSMDVFMRWTREAQKASDIAFPDDGTVWCNCTLTMMAGWTLGEVMSPHRFEKIREGAEELCPESFNQLSTAEDDDAPLFDK